MSINSTKHSKVAFVFWLEVLLTTSVCAAQMTRRCLFAGAGGCAAAAAVVAPSGGGAAPAAAAPAAEEKKEEAKEESDDDKGFRKKDRASADVKKQTVFFLQTADVWSTSSAAEACRCGPQTADVLTSKKQTPPKRRSKSAEEGTKKEGTRVLKVDRSLRKGDKRLSDFLNMIKRRLQTVITKPTIIDPSISPLVLYSRIVDFDHHPNITRRESSSPHPSPNNLGGESSVLFCSCFKDINVWSQNLSTCQLLNVMLSEHHHVLGLHHDNPIVRKPYHSSRVGFIKHPKLHVTECVLRIRFQDGKIFNFVSGWPHDVVVWFLSEKGHKYPLLSSDDSAVLNPEKPLEA
ncbi:hypothetical protein LXL04_006991 [Taraxacum kok-saghyz]